MAERSPSAEAVLAAVKRICPAPADEIAAVALRAVADQVVPLCNAPKIPFDAKRPTVEWHVWYAKQLARNKLLDIATELEGAS